MTTVGPALTLESPEAQAERHARLMLDRCLGAG